MTLFFRWFWNVEILSELLEFHSSTKSRFQIYFILLGFGRFLRSNLPTDDGHSIFQVAPKRAEKVWDNHTLYMLKWGWINYMCGLTFFVCVSWKLQRFFQRQIGKFREWSSVGTAGLNTKSLGPKHLLAEGKKKNYFQSSRFFAFSCLNWREKKENWAIFGRTCMGNLLFFSFFN